jgi:hypothetical protein
MVHDDGDEEDLEEHEAADAVALWIDSQQSERQQLKAVLAQSATEVDPSSAEKPYRPVAAMHEAMREATSILLGDGDAPPLLRAQPIDKLEHMQGELSAEGGVVELAQHGGRLWKIDVPPLARSEAPPPAVRIPIAAMGAAEASPAGASASAQAGADAIVIEAGLQRSAGLPCDGIFVSRKQVSELASASASEIRTRDPLIPLRVVQVSRSLQVRAGVREAAERLARAEMARLDERPEPPRAQVYRVWLVDDAWRVGQAGGGAQRRPAISIDRMG